VAPHATLQATKVAVMPAGMTAAEGALELLPIPAVVAGQQGGRLLFEMPNSRFLALGLGPDPASSPLAEALGTRIIAFLDNGGDRAEFDWRMGDAVEERHFSVMLARVAFRAEPRCFVSLVEHTGEIRTERNLRREMSTDSLTGLPNRGGFGDQLETRIMEGDRDFAVMVIDLDRFSRINACLGGMAGDELLITVARRIKGALRASDVLGRTGGDEFGVLLGLDAADDEAEHVARRIRAALATMKSACPARSASRSAARRRAMPTT
jgi:diguanylate cyclase (GGDEF)-like protein